MEHAYAIVDAFVDGEAVDPAALKRALADPAGRDYLIDVWLLRGLVQDELSAETLTTQSRLAGRSGRWLLAAAAAGICLVGGYLAGTRFPGPLQPRETATAVIEDVSGSAPPAFPVPAATRVIRLELDPNWKESGGGQ